MSEESTVYKLASKDPEDCRVFNSLKEIQNWVKSERDRLNWGEVQNHGQSLRDYLQLYNVALAGIENACHPNEVKNLPRRLEDFATNPGFTTQSTMFNFLKDFAAKVDGEIAGQAGLILANRPETQQRPRVLGQVLLFLYRAGVFDDGVRKAERAASEGVRVDWGSFLGGLKAEWKKTTTEADATVLKMIAAQASHEDGFKKQLQESERKLEELRAFYSEKMALQAPVVHWRNQRNSRRAAARWFTFAFIAVLAGGAWALSLLVDRFVLPQLSAPGASGDRLWVMTLLLLAAGAVTWPLRMLSKMIMSNVHLASDAEERAVLANVYLSLLADKSYEFKDEERKIILTTLFRSGATGIVADDGSSNSAVDFATKLLSK